MLKKAILFLLLFCSIKAIGQVDANLLVNIHEVTDTVAMNAILNPEAGILVFNTAENAIFVYNGTSWVAQKGDPIEHQPYISIYKPLTIEKGTTGDLKIKGSNFTQNTQLTIELAAGTLNSFTVESPQLITANFTASNILGFYDIMVSENGNTNTSWAGNAVDKIEVWGYDGTKKERAGTSCKAILDANYSTGDKAYWINPDGGSTDNAFQADCDMTTNGGGWTKVEYLYDHFVKNFWTTGDARKWLPSNFTLKFTDTQINAIRNISTEAKQKYVGHCDGVIHYYYTNGNNYLHSIGFRYHTGYETNYGSSTYLTTNITVPTDGCKSNSGSSGDTIFELNDIRLPIINVNTRDSGNPTERFGSPLTANPVWFR